MICDPANPKGTGPVSVWLETFPVRFGAIDRSDRLTQTAVFQFFQEAAISHAENLGAGREDLAESGRAWILSRMSVLVKRRPRYRETITVRSWPRGSEKLFAIRDYDILDEDGVSAVFARGAWLVVDMEKRRPLRPQSVVEKLPANEGMETFPSEAKDAPPIESLAVRSDLQKSGGRKALYADIDYNGHVNNARYIQWIEDLISPGELEKADETRFDINYLSEILAGESVDIFSAPIGGVAFAFEGRKAETGQAAFRAELRLVSQ